jgi:hypothetical protein
MYHHFTQMAVALPKLKKLHIHSALREWNRPLQIKNNSGRIFIDNAAL